MTMIPDPAPDDDTTPIPLDRLHDEALDAARRGGWVRVGPDGTPHLTPDAVEHVAADLILAGRGEVGRE